MRACEIKSERSHLHSGQNVKRPVELWMRHTTENGHFGLVRDRAKGMKCEATYEITAHRLMLSFSLPHILLPVSFMCTYMFSVSTCCAVLHSCSQLSLTSSKNSRIDTYWLITPPVHIYVTSLWKPSLSDRCKDVWVYVCSLHLQKKHFYFVMIPQMWFSNACDKGMEWRSWYFTV